MYTQLRLDNFALDVKTQKNQCTCQLSQAPETDGVIRVQREKKGRGGKTVTTITGFSDDKKVISDLLKKMKKTLWLWWRCKKLGD